MRGLPKRPEHDCESAAGQKSKAHRRPDPGRDEGCPLPLHDLLPRSSSDQTRGENHRSERRRRMTPITGIIPQEVEELLSRRNLLKGAGMLVVSFAAFRPHQAGGQTPAGPYPEVDFHQLDSWIVIHEDSSATFYVGKTDFGQGTGTSFRQIMADELDVAYQKTTCIMGRTAVTVDQGGSGGSTAMERDSWAMRRAAAEAGRVLLKMGSERLGVAVDQLKVSAGVIAAKSDPSKSVTYGQLIGGKKFNVTLTGSSINAMTGTAPVKAVQELK